MDFFTTLTNVLLLVALSVPGYILKKCKLMPDSATKVLANLLLYVCMPFLCLSSFAKKQFDTALGINMLLAFVLGLFVSIAAYCLCRLIFGYEKDRLKRGALVASSFMSNFGFMGIPVILALFPDRPEMLLYAVAYLVAGNIISWSLTVFSVTGEKKYISFKHALLNPPMIAFYIALPLFLINFNYPEVVVKGFDYFGDMSVVLSMLLVGMRLADCNLKSLFNVPSVYVCGFTKLILVPLFTLALLLLLRLVFPIDNYVILCLYIIMAMPTLNNSLIVAERFGGDVELISKCILFSNMLCVLTIPVMTLLTSVI